LCLPETMDMAAGSNPVGGTNSQLLIKGIKCIAPGVPMLTDFENHVLINATWILYYLYLTQIFSRDIVSHRFSMNRPDADTLWS
jgi:hypothetical protein